MSLAEILVRSQRAKHGLEKVAIHALPMTDTTFSSETLNQGKFRQCKPSCAAYEQMLQRPSQLQWCSARVCQSGIHAVRLTASLRIRATCIITEQLSPTCTECCYPIADSSHSPKNRRVFPWMSTRERERERGCGRGGGSVRLFSTSCDAWDSLSVCCSLHQHYC